MRKLLYILPLTLIVMLMMSACSDSGPDILPKSEMEDILYDIHLAQGVSDVRHEDNRDKAITYRAAIFKKYGITQAEWDSSFTYYCRHTSELHDIYQDLTERIENDIELAGGTVARNGDTFVGTDTTDVWNQENQFILMPYSPYNMRSFHIDADTTYHAGDRFIFRYDTNFLVQGGMRDVVVVIALRLANDSIVTQVAHKSQPFPSEIVFSDVNRKGIKSISGYIMMVQGLDEEADNYFRLVAVDKVNLWRAHVDEKAQQEREQNDALAKSQRDSMKMQNGPESEQTQDENSQPSGRILTRPVNAPRMIQQNVVAK